MQLLMYYRDREEEVWDGGAIPSLARPCVVSWGEECDQSRQISTLIVVRLQQMADS